ncbi:hypothetical protein chiPu_0024708, partial [Chiloscyllium punctatum]|nr:hypothetical protein [Chiloscyllium punctatum]
GDAQKEAGGEAADSPDACLKRSRLKRTQRRGEFSKGGLWPG